MFIVFYSLSLVGILKLYKIGHAEITLLARKYENDIQVGTI